MKTTPTALNDRIDSLDIIRGFALFGIFIANMQLFQWPQLIADLYIYPIHLSPIDQKIRMLLDIFIETKFFGIFSFLFGLGFYIFMSNAERRGAQVYRLFTRRLSILACFGIFHMIFIWYGDILLIYALAGFLLMLFYKRKPKTILIWVLALTILLVGLLMINFIVPIEVFNQAIVELQADGEGKLDAAVHSYQNDHYFDWLVFRFKNEVIPVFQNMPFSILAPLLMFLLGLYTGKRGIFQDFAKHKPFVKRVWSVCLVGSIPLMIPITMLHLGLIDFGVRTENLKQVLVQISSLLLSLFYISSILLLLQYHHFRKLLKPFSYAGRMALTNYITQSVIGVSIFTRFGLYGEVNLRLGILICLIVFPLQIIFSYYWLKHFRFGPLEWIWRSLTYGRFQPMRVKK